MGSSWGICRFKMSVEEPKYKQPFLLGIPNLVERVWYKWFISVWRVLDPNTEGSVGAHPDTDGKSHGDVVLNNTHRASNGTDHTYIDQDVRTSSSPEFVDLMLTGTLTAEGLAVLNSGARAIAVEYGASFAAQVFADKIPEHTNQSGWYDYTGGAFESLLIKTAGDDFTQADADDGNWVLFNGGAYVGAICEIKEFIDADNVIVSGMGWNQDINSSGTPGTFITIKHPAFISGDGFKHEFSTNANGEFEVQSYAFTGDYMSKFIHDAAANAADGMLIKSFANGYSNVQSLVIDYISGNLGPAESGGAVGARVDVSMASGADSTTKVACYIAVVSNGSDAESTAYGVLPGFTNALSVSGADDEDPGYGYEITSGVVADRVNGGTADTTAFLDSSASNLDLYDNDNDYILIGSDNTFEVIEATLTAGSSKNIAATYEYSTGNGTWSTLALSSEGTLGFQQTGQIAFSAPVGWAKGNEAEAAADITSAYYIRITRTYSPAMVTLPNEDHFKIYADKEQGMKIRGDGSIQPVTMADVDAENESMYYSSTQSKLVYKDGGGIVNDLY